MLNILSINTDKLTSDKIFGANIVQMSLSLIS